MRFKRDEEELYIHINNLLKINNITECIEWQGSFNTNGYGQFRFNNKNILVHRYIWQCYNGIIPILYKGHQSCICHHCDNPKCSNILHLFLGNRLINAQDKINKGRGNGWGNPYVFTENIHKTESGIKGITVLQNDYKKYWRIRYKGISKLFPYNKDGLLESSYYLESLKLDNIIKESQNIDWSRIMEFSEFSKYIERTKIDYPKLIIMVQGNVIPIITLKNKYYRTWNPHTRDKFVDIIERFKNHRWQGLFQDVYFGDDNIRKVKMYRWIIMDENGRIPPNFSDERNLKYVNRKKSEALKELEFYSQEEPINQTQEVVHVS